MDAKSMVNGFNSVIMRLTEAPLLGPLLRKGFVEIAYVGRRSGKTFTTPVNYRRSGDSILIGVAMPDRKKWWRNFTGDGGPITLRLPGGDRGGHAVAVRDERGRVTVRVRLDDTGGRGADPGNN